MTPNDKGRYCNSCAKTVIDFTSMTDEQVQHFFFDHRHEAICGHFKKSQLHCIVIDLPKNIFTIKMPAWMRFLVACLLIFGISMFPFETTIAGKPASEMYLYQGEPLLKKQDTTPIIKKKTLRPDEAVETEFLKDGYIHLYQFENNPKKNKPKPDSIKNCAPKDSLEKNTSKTDLIKNVTPPEQKNQPRKKDRTSAELMQPALLPNKEETNTEVMD